MARRKRQGPVVGGVVGGRSHQRLQRRADNPNRRAQVTSTVKPRPKPGRMLSLVKLPFTLWGRKGGPQVAASVERRNERRRRQRDLEAGEDQPYVEAPRRPPPGGKGAV